jgi:hypothetical protein
MGVIARNEELRMEMLELQYGRSRRSEEKVNFKV